MYGDLAGKDLSPEVLKEYSDGQLHSIMHQGIFSSQKARLQELSEVALMGGLVEGVLMNRDLIMQSQRDQGRMLIMQGNDLRLRAAAGATGWPPT